MKKYLILLIPLIILIISSQIPNKIYLTEKYYNGGKFIKTKEIEKLKEDNYILYTYNPFCSFPKPCEEVFKSFMAKYKIDIISMPFIDFKNTYLYKSVKYAPSVIIVKKGKIVSYLDAGKDEDIPKYQEVEKFTEWIKKYVHLKNQKS